MVRTDTRGIPVPQPGLQAAMRAIVVDALSKGVGGTLTKNTQLRTDRGISTGTIQRALDVLADEGALQTVSRGHLGRRIEAVDVGVGWRTARLAPVRVVLSPAGAVEFDAVESAVGESLTELGIPHTIHHLRGGAPRLLAVRDGQHDLTVVSAGTLTGMRSHSGAAWSGPTRLLDPGSYYAADRLLTVRRADDDPAGRSPLRVAIDRESFDHEALTLAELPERDGLRYVDVPFPEVPAYVAAGVVDVGVWHVTRSPIPVELAGLRLVPFTRAEAQRVRDDLSRAAIVGWDGRQENRAVLAALRLEQITDKQHEMFAEEQAQADRLTAARARAAS